MNRILLGLFVLLVASLAVPLAVSAAVGDSPRACADFDKGGLVKFGGSVDGFFSINAPLCKGGVSYTVYVSDGTTTTAVGPTAVFSNNGFGDFSFEITLDPSTVGACIYAEASVGRGHHVIDRIPDTGCHWVTTGGTVVYDYDYPF